MRHYLSTSVIAVSLLVSAPVWATTFTPTFDTPSFPGTQFDVESDPSYNEFYAENFGITVSNSYLYVDPRDMFDGIGIANGDVADNSVPGISGRIDFLDTTDFVDLTYVSIRSGGTYEAYSVDGTLLDSLSNGPGTVDGTKTFDGGIISYITFTGIGGEVGISGLTYSYDGTTDGTNTSITDPIAPIPLPAALPLLLAGLGALGVARGRKSKN